MLPKLKCPLCGHELDIYENEDNETEYYRCSNRYCRFSLRENYDKAELYLQGVKLKSTCVYCGKPLTVTEGPFGLYGRCFNCKGDRFPYEYDSEVKFANARRYQVRDEIEDLIMNFYKENRNEKFEFDIDTEKFEDLENTEEFEDIEKFENTEDIKDMKSEKDNSNYYTVVFEGVHCKLDTKEISNYFSCSTYKAENLIKLIKFLLKNFNEFFSVGQLAEKVFPELDRTSIYP